MATEVARLVATLEADVRSFERDLKSAERRLDKFEKETGKADRAQRSLDGRIRGVGLTMKSVFAGAAGVAAIGFMKDSVSAASDLNESINAVNVTFGESAEGILALGRNAAESVGLANSEFNQLAVGFSAFVDAIDRGQGNVAGVMEDLTGRISDFASVMNLDVPEAAQKFRAGLAGETEPLRQFGIDVSAAAVTTKALALGLADTASELDEQDKILARYHLIMQQTEKTAGDFANTSDDLANKQRILKARLKDAQAELGKELVPAFESLLSIGEKVIPVLGEIADVLAIVTGNAKLADQAIETFVRTHGRAPRTIRETVDALRDEAEARFGISDAIFGGMAAHDRFIEALKETIRETDLTHENYVQLRDIIRELAEDGELLIGEQEELEDVLIRSGQAAKDFDRGGRGRSAVSGLGDAAEITAGKVGAIEGAVRGVNEALLALDFGKMLEFIRGGGAAGRPFPFTAGERSVTDPFFGTPFTPSLPSSVTSPTQTQPITSIGGISANQFGGHLLGGAPSIVGEGGPELFVPQTSGTVINLSQHFQRAEGANLDSDISRGILLSGIGRFIESSPR